MKTCSRCCQLKPLDAFYADRSKGLDGRMSHCKACVLAKYHQARADAITIYGGVCVECGSDADLEFDHLDWDGFEHRRAEQHGAMYRRIVREGRPLADRRLRLLCGQCHHARVNPEGRPLPSLRLARARKHQEVITTMTRTQAAELLGVKVRTIQGWRQALRLDGVVIDDRNHPWTKTQIPAQ